MASRSTRPIRRARASASPARDSSPRWARRIIKGRDFSAGDLPNTVPVAIVNQVFVDRYLKGRDPIGVQFSAGYPAARSEERGDDRRRDRRRAAEVARRAGGAGVLLAADAVSASARDRRRVRCRSRTSAPSSEPSARRCGSSIRPWRSISSSRRTSSAARFGGRSSG